MPASIHSHTHTRDLSTSIHFVSLQVYVNILVIIFTVMLNEHILYFDNVVLIYHPVPRILYFPLSSTKEEYHQVYIIIHHPSLPIRVRDHPRTAARSLGEETIYLRLCIFLNVASLELTSYTPPVCASVFLCMYLCRYVCMSSVCACPPFTRCRVLRLFFTFYFCHFFSLALTHSFSLSLFFFCSLSPFCLFFRSLFLSFSHSLTRFVCNII